MKVKIKLKPFDEITEIMKSEILVKLKELRCDELCEVFSISKNTLDRICDEKFNPENKKNQIKWH